MAVVSGAGLLMSETRFWAPETLTRRAGCLVPFPCVGSPFNCDPRTPQPPTPSPEPLFQCLSVIPSLDEPMLTRMPPCSVCVLLSSRKLAALDVRT